MHMHLGSLSLLLCDWWSDGRVVVEVKALSFQGLETTHFAPLLSLSSSSKVVVVVRHIVVVDALWKLDAVSSDTLSTCQFTFTRYVAPRKFS
jgi:hypothetical protein